MVKNRCTFLSLHRMRWCTNTSQPGLETLLEIARVLDVDIKELLNSTRDDVQLVRIQKQ